MTALVDTSIIAHDVEGLELLDQPWAISVITVGELQAGVLLARKPATRARRLALLSAVVQRAPVLPVEHDIAASYAQLRAAIPRHAHNDLWIAATAIAREMLLLTADAQQAALPGITATLLPVAAKQGE